MPDVRPNYIFGCTIARVIDGDTIEVFIDFGDDIWRLNQVRLWGLNCPETRGDSRQQGLQAKEEVLAWLSQRSNFVIQTRKNMRKRKDTFQRFLAKIYGDRDGVQSSLNDHLLQNGFAKPYMDERPFDDQ